MKCCLRKIISVATLVSMSAMMLPFSQSVAIAQNLPTPATVEDANAYLNLSYQQLQDDQPEAALRSNMMALTLYQQLGDRLGVAQALGNIGLCQMKLGKGDLAISAFESSLEIAEALQAVETAANAAANLGSIHTSRGEYDIATDYLQRSLTLANQSGNQLQAQQAQYLLAKIQTEQENLAATAPLIEDFVEALVQSFQDNPEQALADLEAQGYVEGSVVLLNQSVALRMAGEHEQAIEVLESYVAAVDEEENPLPQMMGRLQLAYTYWHVDNLAKTESTLKELMTIGEDWAGWNESGLQSDRNNIANLSTINQTHVYDLLQHLLMSQDKSAEALEISERGRSRAFVNLLTQRVSPANTAFSANPPTVSDIQAIAKRENATLVQYSVIEHFDQPTLLFIWVIQPNGALDATAIDLTELPVSIKELIVSSRDGLGVRGRGASLEVVDTTVNTDSLRQLHAILVEPIESLLPENAEAQVIFVPQGDLFSVPFPALQDADGQYLIENHTISTSPSLQLLALTHQRSQQLTSAFSDRRDGLTAQDFLVVGNPDMPSVSLSADGEPAQLASLPGTEVEANAIAALFSADPIIGAAATEQSITQQMTTSRIIHFATHGLLDFSASGEEERVTFSSGIGTVNFGDVDRGLDLPGAIALTPNDQEDGLLTSAEIFDMNINAELVVLSACDTGLGRITGDGVAGLSRAFFVAGTPSVLASLWAVPDAATAELMTEFYRQLSQGENKSQALRQAMLATMKQYENPKDWAAFTLIGKRK
ncbi:MAG: CHAT domain-containing tetratricopeptide repeat protein [Cyanobacteria bacterium J06650_10]